VYIFLHSVSCRYFILITDEILRTLYLMHDGIRFGKILPKQVGYFGTSMLENREFGLAARSATSRLIVLQVPH
jgi:hypothetical protein